ncbi:MAG TPA: hypothetical protein VGS57_22225 [Thermoanaerobaculia bacterium]|jgi:hypothetical protein|nr:hypothetical protein [Thermoanaerobaculia bacterium]
MAAAANGGVGSCVYIHDVVATMTTARHLPAFLWFTRGGKAYLVNDEASLARVGELHAASPAGRPLLSADTPEVPEETVGERLRRLADELVTSGAARPFDQ